MTCSDVMSQRVKYDAAGRPRGLLFTSSRNVGSAAGKEAGEGGREIVKQLSRLELHCSAFQKRPADRH